MTTKELNHWDDLLNLPFDGGYPTPQAAERLFDELDFQRAVQVYLWALPAMNIDAMRRGSEAVFGTGNHILPVWKDRLNTKTKVTTPNSDVVYAMSYLDLKAGPLVLDVPPQLQGMLDDFWHRPLCDVGFVGPDKGQGGKYLLLPPDFGGEAPEVPCDVLGALGVVAVGVGQPRVGHARGARPRQAGQAAHVIRHELGTGRTVEAEVEEVGVVETDRQRFHVLTSEHGARGLDGARHGNEHLGVELRRGGVDSEQAGLHVPRVLAGLEEEVVGSAFDQAECLLAERVDQLRERDSTGDGDGLGRRPHRARDESHPAVAVERGARLPRNASGIAIDLPCPRLRLGC